jgi:hypothetical protein
VRKVESRRFLFRVSTKGGAISQNPARSEVWTLLGWNHPGRIYVFAALVSSIVFVRIRYLLSGTNAPA